MYEKLCAAAGSGKVKKDALLKRYTTFRIGGPADQLVNVSDADSLKRVMAVLLEERAPYYVIGRGSNLVFDDAGFRGTVVRLCDGAGTEGFRIIEEDDESAVVYAFGGSLLSALSSYACENELSGLEFASGIPGSVGGGVMMNAGAYGGELSQCVIKSCYISAGSGAPEEGVLEGEAQRFGYRDSAYQKNGAIVTGAYFRLLKGRTRDEIASKMRELNARRRDNSRLSFRARAARLNAPPAILRGGLLRLRG